MLRAGQKKGDPFPSTLGDLRALPFESESFNLISCLFDSVNFILEENELQTAFNDVARTLKPGGLFYFDIVTQRMVIQHFAGQEWTEENPGFKSTWNSQYDRNAKIIRTEIRVNRSAEGTVRERIYESRDIEVMLSKAGLTLLCAVDAAGWRNRSHKTVRIDYVAAKEPSRDFVKDFTMAFTRVRKGLVNYAQ
jgi:ubiquinone/menaquinone biosynthesis C-methylase UbiE